MRWREKALAEMTARVAQLGLQSCPVCSSETMTVLKLPVIHQIGGTEGSRTKDEDANILFMVNVECTLCGYSMLFNSERLLPESTATLVVGLSEEEERRYEQESPDGDG